MKRAIAKVLLLIMLCLSAAGCSSAGENGSSAEIERLVIYTSHKEEVYRPILKEFEERTGIWVELVTGGTSELLDRIAEEAGDPKCDIMFGGGVETLEAYGQYFQRVSPGAATDIDESLLDPDGLWTPFSANTIVLIYNTKLLEPADLTGWQDLTRPEFTGKIAFADPAKSGSSFTALATALYACGEEMVRLLVQNLDGHVLDSSGAVLTAVADGEYTVGVTLEETALQRIAAGDPIGIVYPLEGTSCVPDGTSVVLNAPHAENAVRFLNFTLEKDVQQLLADRFYRRGVLTGLTENSALPAAEKLTVVDYDAAWVSENRQNILAKWNSWRDGT